MTGRERKGRIGKNIVLNIVSCEKLNIWELSIKYIDLIEFEIFIFEEI